MSQDNNILLFGNGHLGSFILQQMPQIKWTSRSKKEGIKFNLDHFENFLLPKFLKTIIWSIPPSDKTIAFLKTLPTDLQVIFISSTSVFSSGYINSETEKSPTTKNAITLNEVESFIQQRFLKKVIIRPGGLVDDIRHPQKFFRHSKEIKNSHHRPNLIHTEDVARFISFCIDESINQGEFNLVAPMEQTKKEFYGQFLIQKNINFLTDNSLAKSFDISWMKKIKFTLKYPDLFDYFKK